MNIDQDWVRGAIERHSDELSGNGRTFHNGAYYDIAEEINAALSSDNSKTPKYKLAIINFDDSPAEPIQVLDFDNLLDAEDRIVPPYLRINLQELVDEGVEYFYVTGVGQYCPIESPEQKSPRITFADRLKFSKFTKELSDEDKKVRELSKIMLKCIVDGEKRRDCWSCPAHKQFDELRWYCYIRDDAAKLGIGVDA